MSKTAGTRGLYSEVVLSRITPEQNEKLKQLAVERMSNESHIIRIALAKYLEQEFSTIA